MGPISTLEPIRCMGFTHLMSVSPHLSFFLLSPHVLRSRFMLTSVCTYVLYALQFPSILFVIWLVQDLK